MILTAQRTMRPASSTGSGGPTYRHANSNGSNATSLSIGKPPNVVAGTLMVAIVASPATVSGWTLPSGWTLRSSIGFLIATKVATGSEPSSYTFTCDDSLPLAGYIVGYPGLQYTDHIGVTFASDSGACVSNDIGAWWAGGKVLGIWRVQHSGATFLTPSGMTALASNTVAPAMALFEQTTPATGTRSSTPSTASGGQTWNNIVRTEP
jgi:hypothetical protein